MSTEALTLTSDKPSRLGWWYSSFAAMSAALIQSAFLYFAVQRDWGRVGRMGLLAFVAARLAAWLALWSGGRDHGFRAAAYTSVIFSLCVGLLFPVLLLGLGWDSLWGTNFWGTKQVLTAIGGALAAAWFASWIAVPSSFAATWLFVTLVDLFRKQAHAESSR